MTPLSETCLVALTLSAVARLNIAFEATNSPLDRERYLKAAADMLDRTLPFPDLKAEVARTPTDPVPGLIRGRQRIAAVPPALWRPARIRPNELQSSHYAGFRAVDRALKKDSSDPDRLWAALSNWLSPAWSKYPELATECQECQELRSRLAG